ARRSFFERVHGLSILLVGLRPGAHMREAQLLEGAIDRVVRHRESELLIQPCDEIARPPWIAGIGPSSTMRARKALCLELSLGGTPGEGILMRPSGPCSLNRITQSRNPCHRSWPPLPARRRRARPQSLTVVAPAQHLSLAGQNGEPRRRCSPHALEWPG